MFTPIAHTAVHTQLIGINGFELYQEGPPPTPDCDFDASGACDIADLDDLLNNLGSDDPLYDLEHDLQKVLDEDTTVFIESDSKLLETLGGE